MAHRIALSRRAAKQMAVLPEKIRERVSTVIEALASEPRPRQSLKLQVSGPECRRFRVGDHRIIYEIDAGASQITILKIGHRREIYRNL